jgi:asparagine synthase (glutamine-hydrolysing)
MLICHTFEYKDGKQFDEGDIAERTAEFCGANFHRVNVQPQDMVDHFVDTVWHVEQPVFNFNSVGKYILSKRCQATGIKVSDRENRPKSEKLFTFLC